MVTIRLPGQLRTYAGGQEFIEVPASTADEALRELVIVHPDLGVRIFDHQGRLHAHLAVFYRETEVARDDLAYVAVSSGERLDMLIAVAGGAEDVRMSGFRQRATVEEALAAALEGVVPPAPVPVAVTDCAGRVLAADVTSEVDVPLFRRATMDGYALRAEDTYGASVYSPVFLEVAGQSMPGAGPGEAVQPGGAVRIMTGAPVPEGATAVLRAEDATEEARRLEVRAPVAEGRNVGRVGEDVAAGTVVLHRGRRLLPQDAGLLASIGHDPVLVYSRPRVRIIVSGDELLAPGDKPSGTSIVDSNSPMLVALVERDGGRPDVVRLRDDRTAMTAALTEPGSDVILTAGAASVGSEDIVPILVGELGELRVHGVAMRPSSPTGVGRIGSTPVLLLPGNPVSALVAYDFFAGPVIRTMGGLPTAWPYVTVRLPLTKRLVSHIGRTDYARVVIKDGLVEPLAVSGASVLSSVTRASGFVVIPAGLEGYAEGTEIDVHLYDSQAVS
ncbi:MAG: molybdopterin-binding protein [Acidimicrobiia bacterium]